MSRTRQSNHSRLPESPLIVVENDFRLADPKPLMAKLGRRSYERLFSIVEVDRP
jgi:hypothetical protein